MIALTEGISAERLNDLYSDRYIQRVGYDSRPASPVSHPLAKYFTANVHGMFAGAFLVIQFTKYEVEIHALLHKWAIKYSRKLGEMILDLVFSNEEVLRVTANVLQGLETAKNYCLKLGFKQEGIRRSACLKNGKPIDVYILGLLRQDWRKT